MSRLKLFIVLGFAIMFVAGLEVGRSHTTVASLKGELTRVIALVTGKPASVATKQPGKSENEGRNLLFGEIQLTPTQEEQIHKIFRDAHARADVLGHQFHEFDRDRDEEIFYLLDPQQQVDYEEIQHDRDAKVADLRKEIGADMEKAGADVRALLTPEQQKKYDEVKKKYGHRGGPGGPSPSWRGGPGRHQHPGSPDSGPAPGETAPAQ